MRARATTAMLALLAACSVQVNDTQLEHADIGEAPTRERAIAIADSAFASSVAGWDVARATFDDPSSGFYRTSGRHARFAWMIRAAIELDDGFGAPGPRRILHCYILGDQVLAPVPRGLGEADGHDVEEYVATEFNGGGHTQYEAGLKQHPLPPGIGQ